MGRKKLRKNKKNLKKASTYPKEALEKCIFCLGENSYIKLCRNEKSYNFFCKDCRSSGFIKRDLKDKFLQLVDNIELLHDGIVGTGILADTFDGAVYAVATCILCKKNTTVLSRCKKGKSKDTLFIKCLDADCNSIFFFYKGYLYLFM